MTEDRTLKRGIREAVKGGRGPPSFRLLPLLTSGTVKPIVERTYELEDAPEALRHLIEDRPFGRVVLAA